MPGTGRREPATGCSERRRCARDVKQSRHPCPLLPIRLDRSWIFGFAWKVESQMPDSCIASSVTCARVSITGKRIMAVVRVLGRSLDNAKTMVQIIVHFKFFLISYIFIPPFAGRPGHARRVGGVEEFGSHPGTMPCRCVSAVSTARVCAVTIRSMSLSFTPVDKRGDSGEDHGMSRNPCQPYLTGDRSRLFKKTNNINLMQTWYINC